jgi:Recombination, repair and ssDNA binding protein UvsY
MMGHEELMEAWRIDSILDRSALMNTMYSHPMIHSKYLTILQEYKVSIRKLAMKYSTLKATKTRYYNGEMTKDELDLFGWKQYLLKKPLKSEMETILSGDADLQKIEEKTLYLETLIQSAEMIMKDITNRYYLFKSMVEYEKFQAGV